MSVSGVIKAWKEIADEWKYLLVESILWKTSRWLKSAQNFPLYREF